MSDLEATVKELRKMAKSIDLIAENLHALLCSKDTSEQIGRSNEPSITLEQVRAVLATKSQHGFTDEVRGLLQKYGAPKLSQIDPKNYSALMNDAEELQ